MNLEIMGKVHEFLAKGVVRFDSYEVLEEALRHWEELANRPEDGAGILPNVQRPYAEGVTIETLHDWADAVLIAAYENEGTKRPLTEVERVEDHALNLTWQGTFTEGRFVTVVVEFDDEGSFLEGKLLWDTGTGRPSQFLEIERYLKYTLLEAYAS